MQFWTFYSGRITSALYLNFMMIGRLYQNTKHSKGEMYEFKKYALHEFLVIVLHFDGTTRD